jgi:hypothetical protein
MTPTRRQRHRRCSLKWRCSKPVRGSSDDDQSLIRAKDQQRPVAIPEGASDQTRIAPSKHTDQTSQRDTRRSEHSPTNREGRYFIASLTIGCKFLVLLLERATHAIIVLILFPTFQLETNVAWRLSTLSRRKRQIEEPAGVFGCLLGDVVFGSSAKLRDLFGYQPNVSRLVALTAHSLR